MTVHDELIEKAARVIYEGFFATQPLRYVPWDQAEESIKENKLRASLDTAIQAARYYEQRANSISPCSCNADPVECSHEVARGVAEAEVERLNLEIQGYQTNNGYEKGWEHGTAGGRAWKRERDQLQARVTELEVSFGLWASKQLQARIDAALAEIAQWWGTAQRGDRVLMAVKSILSDLNLASGGTFAGKPLSGTALREAEEADDASEPDPSGRWTGNVLGPFAEHDLDDYSPNGTDDDSVVNGD